MLWGVLCSARFMWALTQIYPNRINDFSLWSGSRVTSIEAPPINHIKFLTILIHDWLGALLLYHASNHTISFLSQPRCVTVGLWLLVLCLCLRLWGDDVVNGNFFLLFFFFMTNKSVVLHLFFTIMWSKVIFNNDL